MRARLMQVFEVVEVYKVWKVDLLISSVQRPGSSLPSPTPRGHPMRARLMQVFEVVEVYKVS